MLIACNTFLINNLIKQVSNTLISEYDLNGTKSDHMPMTIVFILTKKLSQSPSLPYSQKKVVKTVELSQKRLLYFRSPFNFLNEKLEANTEKTTQMDEIQSISLLPVNSPRYGGW